MALARLQADPTTAELVAGFERIRRDLQVPQAFPPEALAEAERAATGPIVALGPRVDRTDLPMVTIDPPGARDLDQAVAIEARGSGYRVWYAIADVAAFVLPGGAIDAEAHERGVTRYSPDSRAPLYPAAVSEHAASLLPDAPRPAVLWRIDLDGEGRSIDVDVRRGVVHSRAQLSYAEVQRLVDDDRALPAGIALLPVVGRAREAQEIARGGIDLDLPDQDVELVDGAYRLRYRTPLAVEGWNAQISLLTGMAAAELMVDAGVGLLRTLPPPTQSLLDAIRRSARVLGQPWPKGASYAEFVRSIDRATAGGAALVNQIARTFRGAGYAVLPTADGIVPPHAAVAAPYAHVTAPLRRLADRAANEVVLSICAGTPVPEWAASDLAPLAEIMQKANQRSAALQRAHVDFVETMVLRDRVGESFAAAVTDRGDQRRGPVIQLGDPAVLARLPAGTKAVAGSTVTVRLARADPATGLLGFELAG